MKKKKRNLANFKKTFGWRERRPSRKRSPTVCAVDSAPWRETHNSVNLEKSQRGLAHRHPQGHGLHSQDGSHTGWVRCSLLYITCMRPARYSQYSTYILHSLHFIVFQRIKQPVRIIDPIRFVLELHGGLYGCI